MVAIDTSVLIRFLTKDDEQLAAKATKAIHAFDVGEALLDRVILAEIGYVLRSVYGFDKKDVVDVYKTLLADNRFTTVDRDLVESTVDIFDAQKPLSFEDSWLLSLKRSKKVSRVLTFDQDLLKQLNTH